MIWREHILSRTVATFSLFAHVMSRNSMKFSLWTFYFKFLNFFLYFLQKKFSSKRCIKKWRWSWQEILSLEYVLLRKDRLETSKKWFTVIYEHFVFPAFTDKRDNKNPWSSRVWKRYCSFSCWKLLLIRKKDEKWRGEYLTGCKLLLTKI